MKIGYLHPSAESRFPCTTRPILHRYLAKFALTFNAKHMAQMFFLIFLYGCLIACPTFAQDASATLPSSTNTTPAASENVIHMPADPHTQIASPTPVFIEKAIDATTVLGKDGTIYALTGLDIPDDSDTPPRALKRLSDLVAHQKCTLFQTRTPGLGRTNRMNQALAHLTCGPDHIWIQGTLVAEGLARVRTTPENSQQASMMLILESSARTQHIGLWANPHNAPLTPETARDHVNGFAIVEGDVFAVAQTRDALFLNFSSDWKNDFTIGIPNKLRKDFSKQRIDLLSLKGHPVRVRGWLRAYNGPYIELDHVNPLEILASDPPDSPPNSAPPSPTSPTPPTGGMHSLPAAPNIGPPVPESVQTDKNPPQ